MAPSDVSRHTLSVLVEDVEGILSRVTGMFSRRGYSIISLVSAQTENPGINRLTIVVDASERIMEQVTKQLNKIVPVTRDRIPSTSSTRTDRVCRETSLGAMPIPPG